MMTKAIETEYRGAVFRSRHEARWAAFFDLIGWRWTYEPFDGNGYIPDFIVHGPRSVCVEVKPDISPTALHAHLNDKVLPGVDGHWGGDVLIVGHSPLFGHAEMWDTYSAGLLAERSYDGPYSVDDAVWARCTKCSQWSVFHALMSYACRPCGHHDGDGFIRDRIDDTYGAPNRKIIEDCWNQAHTETRWVPSK